MFLKSLTLKGFKSFADATVLDLEPGVTVVVGPNGSGKSNIVDAIAWVLGAQAPSAVRSQKMDDVIFAGTSKRPALGRAEVTLTLDNSAGLLPIDVSEVSVSRTLFRSGESEYAINGVSCRLLDVQELLSDAGVGRQQHVIVSQGQIDAVLNARPEDRRAIIEEAAGVLKFRKRKEKSERRLESTEASLLRVQDLLREVRRQLRPLERQADAARRHGDLAAELAALRIHLAGREVASFRTRLENLHGDRGRLQTREEELRGILSNLDTRILSSEAELTAKGDSGLSDELVKVEQLRERARGISMLLVERRRSYERDRGHLMDAGVVANLEADAARLREELREAEAAAEQLRPEMVELSADELTFEAEKSAAESLLDRSPSTISAVSAAAEVRGELRSLRASVEASESESRRLHVRLESLRERDVRLGAEVDRLRAECERAQSIEVPLVNEVTEAEAHRMAVEAELERARDERLAAESQWTRWEARLEALQFTSDSIRARLSAEAVKDVSGFIGTLYESISVDPGWEPAVEAALGESLSAVLVESPADARRALERLRSGPVPGMVISLGALGTGATMPAIPRGADGVREHVRTSRGDVSDLLDALLGAAVRVRDWSAAVDLVVSNPHLTAVTPDGDRFTSSGWRVGAGGSSSSVIDEAIARSEEARGDLERWQVEVQRLQTETEVARQREADVQRRLDSNDSAFTAASESLSRAQSERREVITELDGLAPTLSELDERLSRSRSRVSELEGLLPSLESDEQLEFESAQVRGEARATLEAKASLLSGRRRDLEIREASLAERRQFIETRLAESESRLQSDSHARAEASHKREQLERILTAVDRLSGVVDGHRQVIEIRLAELHETRRRQSDEVRSVAGALDTMRRERLAAERELEEVRERSRRTEVEEAEVRLRLESVVDMLRRELDVEPEVAEAAALPELPEGVSPPARVRDLERELRLMGPVNPLALEEFNELQERHKFLEEQLDDVRTTRRELMRVISAIDAEIQSVFASAFADVSGNFTQLFSTLFPGGQGRLQLTNPDDLLNTGIEIEAKPSGKNVKKLSLLSGGERSLTALAFLFAVFRSRPSPFYVMDEVEAALDDVNLHRFLGLVAEFREEAQLLIVSHQKRTMDAGDSLIGVSMQPGGSSKVVTERPSVTTGGGTS